MNEWANENFIRAFISLSALLFFLGLGFLFPFRKNSLFKKKSRLITNLTFTFGNGLLVKLTFPFSLIHLASNPTFNIFKLVKWPQTSFLFSILFGIVFLDFVIYWQHRLTHKIPTLWRLHRMHHSDLEIDTTSAGRFHLLEIIFSFFVKAFFIILLDIPPLSVLAFEVILNFSSLFNHTNIQLPPVLEKLIRKIVITPDLHRIHHSTKHNEMNSNFGFSVVFWDHLFRSYKNQSQTAQQAMTIGLDDFREAKDQRLLALLKQPFLKK